MNDARRAVVLLEGQQRAYEREQERFDADSSTRPIITNEEALARGSGSGYRIQHHPPVDPQQVKAAKNRRQRVSRAVTRAEERFAEIGEQGNDYDVLEAVRKKKTKFVARPPSIRLSGRTFYKGGPIPMPYLDEIGFARTQTLIAAGRVEQIIH